MTGGDKPFDYQRDIELLSARQWPTEVPKDMFSRITGLSDFPSGLGERVNGAALHYLCNAALSYRIRGTPVQVESLWALAIPEGGGDTHRAVLRGSKAELTIDQGAATRFVTELTIRPTGMVEPYACALSDALASLRNEFPGLSFERAGDGYRIGIPTALRTTHEDQFAAVLEEFIARIDSAEQTLNLGPDLITKYTLLAQARELSHRNT
jgi:hypothetical protein